MRLAIYGAGAMGTVLGAFLTRAGVEIDLISRNESHVRSLKESGAHIVGTVDFTVPVSALLPEEMTGKYDVVFLMTKQRENASAVADILPYLAEGGAICTMQNGLPEPAVAAVSGKDKCIGCAVSWGATFRGNGCAELTSSPKGLSFAVGSIYGDNPNISRVQSVLSHMGTVTAEGNFIGARWAKLSINSAFSSLSAITGFTFGEVAKHRDTRRVAQALLNEAFRVGEAYGITVGKIQGHDIVRLLGYRGNFKKAVSFALIPLAMKNHRRLKSGMYFDLVNGKKCEMDLICGTVVKLGKNTGTPTPVTERALKITSMIESGERTVCPQNIALFRLP